MHIPVNRPCKMVINAQDVIHDVGLPHFRMKMDAVPGIPTTQWFTPKYTTEEMKVRTGNPNFVYEISCDQMCGAKPFFYEGNYCSRYGGRDIKNGWQNKSHNTLHYFLIKHQKKLYQTAPKQSLYQHQNKKLVYTG
jgi:hypothetical protein